MLAAAVIGPITYSIVGGNDNGGQPAFAINRTTGVVSVASKHDFESTAAQYLLNISTAVVSTAPYFAGNISSTWIVTFTGTMANTADCPAGVVLLLSCTVCRVSGLVIVASSAH